MVLPSSHRVAYPVVLWIPLGMLSFRLQGFHLLWPAFPGLFGFALYTFFVVLNPITIGDGLGSFLFARHYSGNRFFLSFPRAT